MHRHLLHINGVKNMVYVPDLWERIASENKHCTLSVTGEKCSSRQYRINEKNKNKLKAKPKPNQTRFENARKKKRIEICKMRKTYGKFKLLNNKCTHAHKHTHTLGHWANKLRMNAKRERVFENKFIRRKLVSAADESENVLQKHFHVEIKMKTCSYLVVGC